MSAVFAELKRRNVLRTGALYLVVAWLVVQVAETVLPIFAVPSWVLQAVVVLVALGLVPTLVFAWVFELTPAGLKRDADVAAHESIGPQTARRMDRLIVSGLVLAVVLLIGERVWHPAAPASAPPTAATTGSLPPTEPRARDAPDAAPANVAAPAKSVAVLPFTALSDGRDDGYFADGLTEEILNTLTQLPGLLVTARTSSFHFKGKAVPIPEIAKLLGVTHVVEGSVRRAGQRVRVTAELVRAQDGFRLWSQSYDRTLADVFGVQSEISASVAQALDVVLDAGRLLSLRAVDTANIDAFIEFQKGRKLFNDAHALRTETRDLAAANRHFERAFTIAPDFSEAWFEHSDRYAHILHDVAIDFTPLGASSEEVLQAHARFVADLDQASAHARDPGRKLHIQVDRKMFSDDWHGLAELLDDSLRTRGCARPSWGGNLTYAFRRSALELADLQRLIVCDPLNTEYLRIASEASLHLGEHDRALALMQRGMQHGEGGLQAIRQMAFVRMARKEFDAARELLRQIPADSREGADVMFAAVEGRDAQARAAIADYWRLTPGRDDAQTLLFHAWLGERDAANAVAARIDARPMAQAALSRAIRHCWCGAPFDLSATPNFRDRIEEAGFEWPPPTAIEFPAKDW